MQSLVLHFGRGIKWLERVGRWREDVFTSIIIQKFLFDHINRYTHLSFCLNQDQELHLPIFSGPLLPYRTLNCNLQEKGNNRRDLSWLDHQIWEIKACFAIEMNLCVRQACVLNQCWKSLQDLLLFPLMCVFSSCLLNIPAFKEPIDSAICVLKRRPSLCESPPLKTETMWNSSSV